MKKEEMHMEKLNWPQIKNKFTTEKDILSYFILVENYEKHLSSKQKDDFLNSDTIDGMISLLDEKQLSHLKSLLIVNYSTILKTKFNSYGEEGLSDWFKENMKACKNELKIDHIYKDAYDACTTLIEKIKNIEKNKQNKKEMIEKYKSNLQKFNGNSVEYREWLALMAYDHGIPDIEKTYDVTKLLRRLNIKYLTNLKRYFQSKSAAKIIMDTRNLEPYFYNLATSKIKAKDYTNSHCIFLQLRGMKTNKDKYDELSAFTLATKDLISKIEDVIKEKNEYIDDKIDSLKTSPKFYEDVVDILRYSGDELYFKDAISEYSKPMASGSAFNDYLRKANFLKIISEKAISSSNIESFRNKMLKVQKYFLDHLTNKKYTVYRGMGVDGLKVLLSKANPKLLTLKRKNTTNKLIFKEINEKKPIVFDEGFVSTSLNKGIAATEFQGKKQGGVFFEIEIPAGSKALVLDYESVINVSREEEVLLAERTKMRINSIKTAGTPPNMYFDVNATVVK